MCRRLVAAGFSNPQMGAGGIFRLGGEQQVALEGGQGFGIITQAIAHDASQEKRAGNILTCGIFICYTFPGQGCLFQLAGAVQ